MSALCRVHGDGEIESTCQRLEMRLEKKKNVITT